MSNTASCPSKRIAAPDTSGLLAPTHARFTACRVSKLSQQSMTTSASATSVASSGAPMRRAIGCSVTCGLIAGEPRRRRFHLGMADVGRRIEDLPLQVREIDAVGVAQRQRAHAGRGEKVRNGRAEAADADDQRMRGCEAGLRIGSELVEQDVPAVAQQLRVIHFRYQVSGIRYQITRIRDRRNRGPPGFRADSRARMSGRPNDKARHRRARRFQLILIPDA